MKNEEKVKMAYTLYAARDSIRKLYGAEYLTKIEEYKHFINACMKKYNIDALNATMKLCDDCEGEYGSDIFNAKILAAYVEIIEPTKN